MLKLLGSLIVICSSTGIGYIYSKVFANRVKQLRDTQYALNMLESEIIYTSTPLVEALDSIGEKGESAVNNLFKAMAEALRNKSITSVLEAFTEAYELCKNELNFKKEEIDILNSFMKSLGNSDMEGQKKNFNITITKLEEIEKTADEVKNKNERLFRYLGLCGGVLVVIILF